MFDKHNPAIRKVPLFLITNHILDTPRDLSAACQNSANRMLHSLLKTLPYPIDRVLTRCKIRVIIEQSYFGLPTFIVQLPFLTRDYA